MTTIRKLIQEILLLESDLPGPTITYSSHDDLIGQIKPLVDATWRSAHPRIISRYPEFKKVLERTRFVPIYPGTQVPPGVMKGVENQVGEFLSKCDGLFSSTKLGIKCRAEGNLSNPPTHNAIYADIIGLYDIESRPASGEFLYYGNALEELISHELAHAIDNLSLVVGKGKLRNISADEIDALFDADAVKDINVFIDNVERRAIDSGADDETIDTILEVSKNAWDHFEKWFAWQPERVAIAIQLITALDLAGMSGNDFIRSNIYETRSELDGTVIDATLSYLMYGLLNDEIDEAVSQLQNEIL